MMRKGASCVLVVVPFFLLMDSRGDFAAVAFTPTPTPTAPHVNAPYLGTTALCATHNNNKQLLCDQGHPMRWWKDATKYVSAIAIGGFLSASVAFAGPVWAENELSDRYGGAGLDTSLVDQTCLIDKCSLQAKACLADDPNCRKGLTCTAKCLGDNSCITGCMARYGNDKLDNFLKCTIEDNECIKIAILQGGADQYGQEPRAPGPTLANFDPKSLQGSWYKVAGFNPNYDCYACQRNSFELAGSRNDQLQMDVEFSMPHLLPDGSPPPPINIREIIGQDISPEVLGPQSIGLNAYHTRETMLFDQVPVADQALTWNKGGSKQQGVTYARTAHSEGEMFGLKFWENWYVLGENDPGTPEFKFIYYNGKTRQNTYEGAFVYSRTRELAPESMMKVYQIAKDAGMNPDQFCKIRNGCFTEDYSKTALFPQAPGSAMDGTANKNNNKNANNPFRGILASTKVSEILGVEPVAARDMVRGDAPTAQVLQPRAASVAAADVENIPSAQSSSSSSFQRAWWYEVGDYLENPHRHFKTMDSLRAPMEWPSEVVSSLMERTTTTTTR